MPEWILILTVGLPRSGKSTWARKQKCPIVNRDAIRLALHGKPYIQEAESIITSIEEYMVKSLFLAGHDKVIVDSTNLKEKYRQRWEYGPWDIEYKIFDADKNICIERAKADKRDDLIPVIERMSANLSYPQQN